MTITHHVGHVLDIIRELPDNSIDLAATSPPFWALRNYNDTPGQWGSEPTPAAFLDNQLALAVELRRVLTPHGSIAIELGDTFAGSGGAGGDYNAQGLRDGQPAFRQSNARTRAGYSRADRPGRGPQANDYGANAIANNGLGCPPAKSLCGIPTLYAWSLAYGRNLLNPDHTIDPWRVRNVIVWARNNPPVGALGDKYRPATSYITVATPSAKRWFDLDAVRTPYAAPNQVRRPLAEFKDGQNSDSNRGAQRGGLGEFRAADGAGAPPLDHWTDEYDGDTTWLINTVGSSLAHYAMWPASLAQRLILSMCPAEVCRNCGEPRRRIDNGTRYVDARGREHTPQKWESGTANNGTRAAHSLKPDGRYSAVRLEGGWSDCGHDNYRPGVTLDPFAGTGTTLAAADLHGRDAIGIDLDGDNTQLHQARYDEVKRSLFGVAPPMPGQMELIP